MRNFYLACKTIHELHIKSNAILVYYDLCRRANKEDVCWPSKQTIADACNISKSTVTRSLRELEKVGMITTVTRFRHTNNRQTSNIYQIFDTPQQFTQFPEEPTDLSDINSEQEAIQTISEPSNLAACMQNDFNENKLDKTPLETPVSASTVEMKNYTPTVNSCCDGLAVSEESEPATVQPNYSDLSSLNLLFCCFKALFDTLPRVSVTPQGTIPGKKVTVNLRKESILTKVAKWYKQRHLKKHAGLGYTLAKNE